jgi:hypothetical protein
VIQDGAGSTVARALAATSTAGAALDIADCDTCDGGDWPRDFGTWGISTTRVLSVRTAGRHATTPSARRPGRRLLLRRGGYPERGHLRREPRLRRACTTAVTFTPSGLPAGLHHRPCPGRRRRARRATRASRMATGLASSC